MVKTIGFRVLGFMVPRSGFRVSRLRVLGFWLDPTLLDRAVLNRDSGDSGFCSLYSLVSIIPPLLIS